MYSTAHYWDQQYIQKKTAWDIGYASPSIIAYFDQVFDKTKRILIPGAGNAWEAEYLWNNGFQNTFVLDFSQEAIRTFKTRMPHFPESHIIYEDFFQHNASYDIIVEQTFFSSLPLKMRTLYVWKMHHLLQEKGKLIGLLFNHHFNKNHPPFGGTAEEYQKLFSSFFTINVLKEAYNSIKPRKGREHFLLLEKRIDNNNN